MNETTEKRKLADEVARWEAFCAKHAGVFPPRLAAAHLDLTVQGVHAAADRGHLAFILVGRERYYSRKDVAAYKWSPARRGKHSIYRPPHPPTVRMEFSNGLTFRQRMAIRTAAQDYDPSLKF